VQRDAFLIAVEGLVEMAVARPEIVRPHGAAHVAAVVRVLYLDHFGAQVGQMLRAERPRAILLYRDDAQSCQRQAHMRFLSTSCRAMMMRCISLVPSPITSSGASR